MVPDVWVQTMIAYSGDGRMEGAAYRELWCQGYTVEEISGMCQVDEIPHPAGIARRTMS